MTSAVFHRNIQFQQTAIFPQKTCYPISNQGLLICAYEQWLLVLWSWDRVPLQFFMQKPADIPTSVHREHIFHALCMGFPPAGLLTHTPLPPPCLQLSTALTTSSLPLGQAWSQTLCSQQVEGTSRHLYCYLLLKASLVRVGCSNQDPCPVKSGNGPLPWAPLPGLGHPHSEFFLSLYIRWSFPLFPFVPVALCPSAVHL